MMIVQLWKTVRMGQEEAGTIRYEDGQLRVDGVPNPESLLYAVFRGPVPEDPGTIEAALADMPRRWDGTYLRAQVVMGEGGKGSGWFAPPKGTHTKKDSGVKGTKSVVKLEKWLDEVRRKWPEYRGYHDQKHRSLIARRAIERGISDTMTTTYALFEDGELVAVVNIADFADHAPDSQLDGMREITYMATKREGYGLKASIMALQQIGDEGAWWYANEESEGFYERMGANRLDPGGYDDIIFYIPRGFKELSRRELGKMDLTDLEPEHGVFIATRTLREGGEGSGWFAPPKGTHRKGSQGGKLTDDEFGSQIAMDANETAIVIYDGKESFRKEGDATSVEFTPDQRGQLKDCKIIHNHPNGTTLSGGDLAFAAQEDLKEIQAVSHIDEKTFRRDRMVRGPDGWRDRDTVKFIVALRGNQLQEKYRERIADGTLTGEEAVETFWPELYELIDDEAGFDYIEEVGHYVD